MKHPNRKITDWKKLSRLYENGSVFVAFDTETSTITPTTGRIIEIGAVKFNKYGTISTWQHLFNPGQILSSFITNLTHITQDMVENEDFIDAHIKDFLQFVDDSIFVAHNARFDLNFLNSECENCGLPVTKNLMVDTLYLSQILFPYAQKHKLDYLADYFQIEKGSSHRALDDALTCKELFELCMAKLTI